MNHNNTKRDRYAFFEFNGKYYGQGTIVKFKPSYLSHLQRDKELYGRYDCGTSYTGYHQFRLGNSPTKFDGCCGGVFGCSEITVYDIIEEIITPIEVPYVSYAERERAVNDWEDGELIIWWVVYLFVMLGSCIFVWPLRLFLWAAASFIFWGCRHEKLKEYGYK